MKVCNICLVEKELYLFPKKGAKCKICVSEYKKEYLKLNKDKIEEYRKQYYKQNKQKVKDKVKKWGEDNIEKLKISRKEYNKNNPNTDYHAKYRDENRELISIKRKEYYKKNKEKVKKAVNDYSKENRQYVNSKKRENRNKNKESYNEKCRNYIKNRKENDPLYRLSCNIRGLIANSFKGQFTKKAKKTIEILGCSFEEFKTHIQNQFTDVMNWDNYSTYWQLDHIKPISWAKSEQDVYDLNHYTNFQPLYWKDNISKGNRWEG